VATVYFVSEVIVCKSKLLNANDIRAPGDIFRQEIARLEMSSILKGFSNARVFDSLG
jgi:hypothetical protein